MTRTVKQAFYGLIYLLILAGIVALFYASFLKHVPSCTDGKQNQGEEGIDCGAVCRNFCIPSWLEPVRARTTETLPLESDEAGISRVTLLSEVENPNQGFAASAFQYRFEVYGEGGTLLSSVPGSSFAYARAVKYVIAPNVRVRGKATHASLVVEPGIAWKPESLFPKPVVAVQGARAESVASGEISVEGSLINRDPGSVSSVTLIAVFYTSSGKIRGASLTGLENVRPGETRGFRILHPALPDVDLGKTRIFAEPSV